MTGLRLTDRSQLDKLAYAVVLVFALALSAALSSWAYADEDDVSDTPASQQVAAASREADQKRGELQSMRDQLSQKTQELSDLTLQVEGTQAEIDRIEGELGDLTTGITAAQEEHAHQQERLAEVAVLMYKADAATILDTFSEAKTFSELLGRVYQIESIARQAADLAAKEAATAQSLQSSYDMASFLLDEKASMRESLAAKLSAAEQTRAELEDQVARTENDVALADQRAQSAAALARASQAAAASQASIAAEAPTPPAPQQAAQEGAVDQLAEQAPAAQEQPAQEAPVAEQAPVVEEQVAQTSATGSTEGWQTGVASAYGGSSDASTPNPGSTATGAVCDDWSMGVAVPMAWGAGAYYGRQVEISYNGQSVIATVNDCGGMGDGARALDLQPGVFKALGFSTCQDWGLREVSYRFL